MTDSVGFTQKSSTLDDARVEKFVGRVVEDVGTALRGALCYIGDKLGIYKAMADTGAVTIDALALRTGLNARYLREWLGSMATAGYVEYRPENDTYFLPPEHAAILADEDHPFFVGGFLEMIVPMIEVTPKVAASFLTGKGVPQTDYSPEMFEAIERATAPWYKNQLVQNWIPAMPDVKAKLEQGCTALDVGCGSGLAAITLAKAFPKSQIFGFDGHAGSIERARNNARAAGAENRVHFDVFDCVNLPPNKFDFISTFDVIHDAVDPLGIMRSIRKALTEDGTYLLLELNCSDHVHENINPIGRLLYSSSTLYCMTTSLAHNGAGIGAVMGPTKARDLAQRAGFSHFRKLPVDDPFSVLYELKTSSE